MSVRLFHSPEGNPKNLCWDDWQRENINQFVRRFYDEATQKKPWLKISAAVVGKYDYSSWNGYHAVFQDGRQWLTEGKMDFLTPMIYWQTDHPSAPFGDIVTDWLSNYIHERYIFPGMFINRLGSEDWSPNEVIKQIHICRRNGNGFVFFSYSGLITAEKIIGNNSFPTYANLPAMSWKDDKPPLDPKNVRADITPAGAVQLIWDAPDVKVDPADVWRYNIFRSERSPTNFRIAQHLINITALPDTSFEDAAGQPGHTYYYVITALDRVNNESPPSNEVKIVVPQVTLLNEIRDDKTD